MFTKQDVPTLTSSGQPFFSAAAPTSDTGWARSGVKGPLMCGFSCLKRKQFATGQTEQVPQTDHLKTDQPHPGWSQWPGRTRSLHLVPTGQHIHQPRQQCLRSNKGIGIRYVPFPPFQGHFLINAIFTTESDLMVKPQAFVDLELYLHVPSFPCRSSCDGCTETQRW